jgi:hypothetical protein
MYSFTTKGATPNTPQGSTPQPSGGTSAARALNGVPLPPTLPLVPPMNSGTPALKSHSIQHPDGTVITQQFHKPEEGMLSGNKKTATTPAKPATPAPMPALKIINGMHHVPFKTADGSMKYINAKGEIS